MKHSAEKKSGIGRIIGKILIALIIMVLIAVIAVVCVFQFYIKPKYGEAILNAAEVLLEDEEVQKAIEEIDIEQAMADVDIADISDTAEENDVSQEASEAVNQKPKENNSSKVVSSGNKASDTSTKTESKPKTVQERIDEVKDEVEPQDFSAGMNIANKLDISYLAGLAGGGITPEEKAEAKKYLKSQLTDAEIAKMKSLISKYSYLLKK